MQEKSAVPLGAHRLVGGITCVLYGRDVRQTAPFGKGPGRAERAHTEELAFNAQNHGGGLPGRGDI